MYKFVKKRSRSGAVGADLANKKKEAGSDSATLVKVSDSVTEVYMIEIVQFGGQPGVADHSLRAVHHDRDTPHLGGRGDPRDLHPGPQ